jgi:lipopolysaccharide heptosyltransferase I
VKALVVRLSSIGDVVHTLPALSALKGAGWEVGWAVEPASRPLLTGHPLLSHLVPVPAARRFVLAEARVAVVALRDFAYDVALDLQGLWKSVAWARLSGAPRVTGFGRASRREGLSSVLLTEETDAPPEAVHVIDRNLALLRALGIDALGLREFPFPTWSAEAQAAVTQLHALGLREFVVLNPGGGWPGKLWPPERYGAVAAGLRARGLRSLVTWGPGEERLADRVVAASDGAAVKSQATTLPELGELLRRARLVVAADTGPLHIACALGTPVVGIYGPTDPRRNGPFSAADLVVRRTPLCSPCHKRRCAVHEGVMQAITEAEVLAAIDRRFHTGPRAVAL